MAAVKLSALAEFDTTTKSNEGVWLQVLTPRKQPTEKHLKLLGRDSEKAKRLLFKETNLRLKAAAKARGNVDLPEAKELTIKARWELAYLTAAWRGFPDESGEDADCTPENAYAVYEAFPDIERQADEFVANPANFGQEGELARSIFDPAVYRDEVEKNSEPGPNTNSAQVQNIGSA